MVILIEKLVIYLPSHHIINDKFHPSKQSMRIESEVGSEPTLLVTFFFNRMTSQIKER